MIKLYESGENYLETIHMIQAKKGCVKSIDIVNELNFSKPSVSIAMKKLRTNGFINVDNDGYITLTESGLEVAEKIYERHVKLTEILKKIGVNDELASEDACRLEHYMSDETFKKLREHFEV